MRADLNMGVKAGSARARGNIVVDLWVIKVFDRRKSFSLVGNSFQRCVQYEREIQFTFGNSFRKFQSQRHMARAFNLLTVNVMLVHSSHRLHHERLGSGKMIPLRLQHLSFVASVAIDRQPRIWLA